MPDTTPDMILMVSLDQFKWTGRELFGWVQGSGWDLLYRRNKADEEEPSDSMGLAPPMGPE